jgi:hypothetical protein
LKNYVRTGKALVFTTRMKGHVSAWSDPDNNSAFYYHYRSPKAWARLQWYVSLALPEDKLCEASRFMVYTKETHSWIVNGTKGKGNAKRHPADTKKINLLCYLSELLDDLMCDPDVVRVSSRSAGFESFLFQGKKK